MALIDVDRHILSSIAYYQKALGEERDKFFIEWRKINEVKDMTDALLFHHVKCPVETEECVFRMNELKKLRNMIFKATKDAGLCLQKMASLHSKQESVLAHLVSLVKEIDTGKGLETDETRHHGAEGIQEETET